MIHWGVLSELAIAVVLSVAIGIEREFHEKAAGMRTCALVGLGAALFTSVSRYGMWRLPGMTITAVDGSRVAAQIVSGIGFLGAGVIFVRRDVVRGLTTAASVWLVAAVGMAVGAGIPDVAIGATFLYFMVVIGMQPLQRRLPHSKSTRKLVSVTYVDGHGVLREVMSLVGRRGASVEGLDVLNVPVTSHSTEPLQTVQFGLRADHGSMQAISQELTEIPLVRQVSVHDSSVDEQDG